MADQSWRFDRHFKLRCGLYNLNKVNNKTNINNGAKTKIIINCNVLFDKVVNDEIIGIDQQETNKTKMYG